MSKKKYIFPQMPDDVYQDLVNLCYVPSSSANEKLMVLYITNEITKIGLKFTIDSPGNILVTKGTAKTYPCVVCHMDTVHKVAHNSTVYNTEDNKLYSMLNNMPIGIGGDDKCGILACLYFLKVLPAIKVVFFTKEEVGCVGSKAIDHGFFHDCRYILQIDRRNAHDFIDKYCGDKTISHAFASEIGAVKKLFNFKSAYGTVTDCMTLWSNKVGISVANISSGYYNPHMNTEYIMYNELWNSILFTKALIEVLKPKRYEHLPPVRTYNANSNYTYKSNPDDWETCSLCKEERWKRTGTIYKGKWICYICNRNIANNNTTKKDKQKETSIIKPTKLIVCGQCNRLFNDTKAIIHGNIRICPKCAANKGVYLCEKCGLEISGEDVHSYEEGFYCSKCHSRMIEPHNKHIETLPNHHRLVVKCVNCQNKINDRVIVKVDGKVYCPECITELGLMNSDVEKCDLCDLPIVKGSEHRDELDCSIVCDDCFRFFSQNSHLL